MSEEVDETRAAIWYGELWQQTHYGTMRVDEARAQIIAFFQSQWFADRLPPPTTDREHEGRT